MTIKNVRFELPDHEHRALKVLVAERGTNLQTLLVKLVRQELVSAKGQPARK